MQTALEAAPVVGGVGRCVVMGVLNVTPDSFSDGGQWDEVEAAIARGHALIAQGADLVDVGGESTRPGAVRVDEAEERRRVLPVVAALAASGAVVSIDTMRASVAEAAVEAGAAMVNDVSGGLADPRMRHVVARTGASYVASHWRGHSTVMNSRATYGDVVTDVLAELRARCNAAQDAGIAPERLIVDPGLGFAKDAEHNWRLLGALPALRSLGFPVLVGASRKRFLSDVCLDPGAAPAERDHATHAISVLAAQAGAWGVRVHEPRGTVEALRVVAELSRHQA